MSTALASILDASMQNLQAVPSPTQTVCIPPGDTSCFYTEFSVPSFHLLGLLAKIERPLFFDSVGSFPGFGRSSAEGNGNSLQYSCLRIPWTEEPGGLQSTGSQRVTRLSD